MNKKNNSDTTMIDTKIAFIGGGNMGSALVTGLIASGTARDNFVVADPDNAKRAQLQSRLAVPTTENNKDAVVASDIIVLAVKPQDLRAVATDLAPVVDRARHLVISLAAGVRTAALRAWFGAKTPIIRVMPNTPALVGGGTTALFATECVSAAQREAAESIMRAVGVTLWLDDERLMDAVTAVSGSGPAYFFLIMEVMEQAAVALGLSRQQARLLVVHTAFGAAKMALESVLDPAGLRVQVTSPGGTTERALQVFANAGLDRIFAKALEAAATRSEELARTWGGP